MAILTVLSSLVVLSIVIPVTALAQGAPTRAALSRASVDGVELEYEVRGTGEPVVLVHAGVFADWFKPLLQEPALIGRYRVASYHRVGYAGSSRLQGQVTIAQQAAQLRALMRYLHIERAHIVGHSSGANIAFQLALDAPEVVQSLTILEPALPVAPSGPTRLLSTRPGMADVMQRYQAGDKAGAVDAFMRVVAGDEYRAVIDRVLPGAFDQAVKDADVFFGQELPAVQQWRFTRDDANRISRPVLAVMGEKSPEVSPIWPTRQQMMLDWLPSAEPFVLRGTTHVLHVQEPRAMAERMATFFEGHPIK